MGLGAFRFVLATLVAISHLWQGMIHGPAAYAVWGFYLLSGYLMAYILNNHYDFSRKGLISFYYNRALRIYPAYYIALICGIVVYKLCKLNGVDLFILNPQFGRPLDLSGIFFNLTLLPTFNNQLEFVPVSSALALEVGFYLITPIICRNKWSALTAVLISFGLNFKFGVSIENFPERYAGFWTALLPFSIGIGYYYWRDLVDGWIPKNLWIVTLIWAINCLFWIFFPYYPWGIGLYISILLTLNLVSVLKGRNSSKIDEILGGMSYLIYLLHTTVGYVLIIYCKEIEIKSFIFFIISYIITLILSFLYVIGIDKMINLKFKRGYK